MENLQKILIATLHFICSQLHDPMDDSRQVRCGKAREHRAELTDLGLPKSFVSLALDQCDRSLCKSARIR